ncbi:hypothetical protein GCM10023169_14270 [Georgenia halophila]|uniref:MlaB-like STAS domain-containing protein n=1 Tax=Georgenia halophila TaxID=620889 RepID=A0ABP8L285_9MICO
MATSGTTPTEGDIDNSFGSVAVLFSPHRTRLVLSGEVDDSFGQELADAVSECATAGVPVEVDARTVAFIDSAGAAHLARLAQALPVRVIQPPDVMQFVMSVSGLDRSVEILDHCPDFPA